jgi:hypothetical protein
MTLKDWNFEKNVPANEMGFVVSKAEKRKLVEGKDTVFFRGDTQISSDRIEHFKKRKVMKDSETSSNVGEHAHMQSHTSTFG